MSAFIEFKDVTFAYDVEDGRPVPVLRHFNLAVEQGDFVAILGHNGCGKSTVAKLCNGIEIPQSGDVTVSGMNTKDEDKLLEIRKNVGMVFQNPDNQIVATIVEDDVAFGPENLGVAPKEIRRRVDEALKDVGMYELRFSEPHKLSGGQKQRVAIAGIIAMQPACIVLDEPTAMLDPRGRKDVMKTVQMLNRDFGITVLYITHFMEEAVKANRVIVMDKGAILLDGTPRDVFQQEAVLRRAGLEVPQATALSLLLKHDGAAIDGSILTIEELSGQLEGLLSR
jgi:energy-coupling factor transport system ATP-binding protein